MEINEREGLGNRCVMGVVAPATNTVVQPEMEALRPEGVINAHARIANPEQRVLADGDTLTVRGAMMSGLMGAVDTLAPARPDHVILGVMVENFVGGGAAGARLIGLKAPSPGSIGHMPVARMRDAVRELNGPDVDVIIQVGTGLPFAELARAAEVELGKPVLASNPVSYWRALRQVGITDMMPGRLVQI